MPEENKPVRIFRGSSRTIIQLIIASIVVGAIFSFVGLSPNEFWRGIYRTFQNIITMLGDSFTEVAGTLAGYLLIGAAIVVPLWLISRLWAGRK